MKSRFILKVLLVCLAFAILVLGVKFSLGWLPVMSKYFANQIVNRRLDTVLKLLVLTGTVLGFVKYAMPQLQRWLAQPSVDTPEERYFTYLANRYAISN